MPSRFDLPRFGFGRWFFIPAAIVELALGGCSLFETKAPLPPGTVPAESSQPAMGRENAPQQPVPTLPAFAKGVDTTVGARAGVNKFLWQGALDTVSFMPLLSADPFGGVIITDWYAPPETPQERFKLTVYILGQDLRSEALRVAVFHQKQTDGQWQDVPTEKATATDLEDTILARAEKLRSQALGSGSGS